MTVAKEPYLVSRMHHFFGLIIDFSYYNEVIIYLYMFYTISVPIFVYSQVSFMRHYYNKPLFSIFYSIYLHKSYLLVSICCYQISDFTIRAPLTARINFGSIHYQQFVKLFDKLFVKPFAMVTYLVFFLLIIMLIITV